ncbi:MULTISPECIES: SIMPL domain-containing protein [unclassified Leptolyngbya]|uniref:SIMPL domain-containing protein n=1 Tax=unclassified Leptolyngbya TaxID=2650499 RepID=UPI003D319076
MMSTIQKSPWKRLGAIPVALGIVGFSMISPVYAQEKLVRTLTVTGRGFEDIQTTIAQVRLGVEVEGKTANDVQQEVARRSNSVVNFLRSRQVEKLETTGINLSPRYDYNNNRQTLIGYTGSNNVSFRVPTERAGGIIDEAVKAGASRIDGVSFVASDDAIAAAQRRALQKATQEANSQADAVFSALNLARKEIVNVQVNGASAPPPIFQDVAPRARAQAATAPSPVVGGEQRVEGSVTLQISY